VSNGVSNIQTEPKRSYRKELIYTSEVRGQRSETRNSNLFHKRNALMHHISRTKEIGDLLKRPYMPTPGKLCTQDPVLGSGAVAVGKKSTNICSHPNLLDSLGSLSALYNYSVPARRLRQALSSKKEQIQRDISFTKFFNPAPCATKLNTSTRYFSEKFSQDPYCAFVMGLNHTTKVALSKTNKVLQHPGPSNLNSRSEALAH